MPVDRILFFSNLFPLPWEPTRAAFNKQIVNSLGTHLAIDILTPVPAPLWFRHVLFGRRKPSAENQTLFPFFYLPGFGRRTYALSLLASMVISGYPAWKMAKAKVILASWAYPDGVTAVTFKRVFGSKVFIHCLGTDINCHFQQPPRRRQMVKAFQRANCVITASQDLQAKIAKHALPGTKLFTIYNGVDLDAFPISRRGNLAGDRLLFIGTLIRTKGIFELVDAMALLREQGRHQIALDIIGSGADVASLKKRVHELQLHDTVAFHGSVPHDAISNFLARGRALVLPSHREGVPNVILEALASGVPPVATAVGGIPEIIADGSNGILIQEHSAEAVAVGIERALQTDWQPLALRASVAHLTWEKFAETLLQAIDK